MPDQFGPYVLEELIGKGAMGRVYRAIDSRSATVVALKRLPDDSVDDEPRRRFLREAQIIKTLHHANIIPTHDIGEVDGHLYIAMKLIVGPNLHELLQKHGTIGAMRAIYLVAQVAEALQAAHDAGLVHRDVKPANILVQSADGVDHTYLIDFGIARAVLDSHLTATGLAVGTMAYMAPERFSSTGDHRVDIYALGCILFELVAGVRAFSQESPPELMNAHLTIMPPRISTLALNIPQELDAVIMKALSKSPADRYNSASEFASEILGIAYRFAFLETVPADLSSGPQAPAWLAPENQNKTAPCTVGRPGRFADLPHDLRISRNTGRTFGIGALTILLILTLIVTTRLLAPKSGNDAAPASPAPLSAPAPKLVGEIPFSTQIDGVAASPDGQHLYITKWATQSVDIVDTGTAKVEGSVKVGEIPSSASFSTAGDAAYVANEHDDSVSVIDTRTATISRTIDLSADLLVRYPEAVAVSPNGRKLYVMSYTGNRLSVVDVVRGTVDYEISLSSRREPKDFVLTPDGNTAYVSTETGVISVIDLRSRVLVKDIETAGPISLAITPDGNRVLVTQGDGISVLNTRTNTLEQPSIGVPYAYDVAVSSSGQFAYAVTSSSLVKIDMTTMSILGQLPVGGAKLALSPDDKHVYVCDRYGQRLLIVADSI